MEIHFKHLAFVVIIVASISTEKGLAQRIGENNSGANADTLAMLDVASTSKVVLIPRMSNSKRNTIVTPVTWLIIYQADGLG